VNKGGFDVQLLLPEDNNRQYALNNRTEVVIGRKSKDFRLQDLQLASQHARLFFEEGRVYL